LKFNALVEKSRKIDIYGKKFKSDGVSRSLKERNEQIKEEVYLFVVDFNNPYFDDDEDDFIKDAYDYEELRKQYEKNLLKSLQDKFLQIIADIHDNFINDIKSDITKNFDKNIIDEDKMNKNITLNSTKIEFERLIRPIYNLECPFISKEMEEEIFNLVQLNENDPYVIFSMVIKDDIVFLSGIREESKTLIKKILKLHDNIREKLGEKNR